MTRVWLLNLDAELELADPDGYCPSSRLRAHIADRTPRIAASIRAGPGHENDRILHEGPTLPAGVELEGVAWCPTPRAVARLRAAGCRVGTVPPAEVLHRANHRGFCAELGPGLPGARFVRAIEALEEVVAGPAEGGGWLLKRPFGFSGRWRKRVASGQLVGDARTWAAASMESYGKGLQVEPWVCIEREFALHGEVGRAGERRLGTPVALSTDASGAWRSNRSLDAGELGEDEAQQLLQAGERVMRALVEVGYFGPFGIDAFRWRDRRGRRCFQSCSDVNARYTMGWWDGVR